MVGHVFYIVPPIGPHCTTLKAQAIVAPLPPCYAYTQAARFRGVSAHLKKRYRLPEKAQGIQCTDRHNFAMPEKGKANFQMICCAFLPCASRFTKKTDKNQRMFRGKERKKEGRKTG